MKRLAAGMWDRMLSFFGFEEEEIEGAEDPAVALPAASAAAGGRAAAARRRHIRSTAASTWSEERAPEHRPSGARSGNLARLLPAAPGIVVCAVRRFDEAQEAADQLKAGKPVLLYLEGMDRELVQRVVHFMMGSVYALGGEMHRVGSVVVFAPAGVDVTVPLTLRMAEREGHRGSGPEW